MTFTTNGPRWRSAAVPRYWLPVVDLRDSESGWWAIYLRDDGLFEVCCAPGLWAIATDQTRVREMVMECAP